MSKIMMRMLMRKTNYDDMIGMLTATLEAATYDAINCLATVTLLTMRTNQM